MPLARQNCGDHAPSRGCQVDNLRYRRVPEDPDVIESKACDRRGFCHPSGVHRFALEFCVLPHTIIGDLQSKLHARSGVHTEKTVRRGLLGGARPANLGRPMARRWELSPLSSQTKNLPRRCQRVRTSFWYKPPKYVDLPRDAGLFA